MKKKTRKIIAALCSLILGVSATSCAEPTKEQGGLPYFDGVAADMSYDTDMFYRNDLYLSASDPDVIWVSEEQDAENGGWFYMYYTSYEYKCMRSKNLVDWEALGTSLSIAGDELPKGDYWAPEVIYNLNYDENAQEGELNSYRYLMYFSARVDQGALGNNNSLNFKRLYIFLAVSNSPSGPFKLYKNEPLLDLRAAAKSGLIDAEKLFVVDEFDFGIIDANPFFDDDGKLYLYFSSSEEEGGNCVYGLQLSDPATPNYSTLNKLLQPKKVSVNGEDFPYEKNVMTEGGAINEAPFMLKHEGKYYLTYSPFSYTNRLYSVCVAIADNPLEGFVKVAEENGNPVIGIEPHMDHIGGTGHASFVNIGDEMFAIYHTHRNRQTGTGNPRALAIDRVTFAYNENLGCDMLYGTGPTYSVQPLPSSVIGYKNIISDATVTATNADNSTIKYLTDGVVVTNSGSANMEFKANGETEITISFSSPRTVRSVMVYNSYDYEYAFSRLEYVQLTLSEKPESWVGEFSGSTKMREIPFNSLYYNEQDKLMRPGGSSFVEFGEAKVTEIKIKISKKLTNVNSIGASVKEIKLSDIVVLGA